MSDSFRHSIQNVRLINNELSFGQYTWYVTCRFGASALWIDFESKVLPFPSREIAVSHRTLCEGGQARDHGAQYRSRR